MKIKNTLYQALGLTLALSATSCLDEAFPTTGVTGEQLQGDVSAIEALTSGITEWMNHPDDNAYSDGNYGNLGYTQFFFWDPTMTADTPVFKTGYDYFTNYSQSMYIGGNGSIVSGFWSYLYKLVQKCNLVISRADATNPGEQAFIAQALTYRALAYFDLARRYEYKRTGFDELDNRATYGITVPIVTETTTEDQGRHNPRAPFYTTYRFILDDLNRAEELLANTPDDITNRAFTNKNIIHGLKARLWLEIGTRFDKNPDDLATQLAHDNDAEIPYPALGITSANDCYTQAAQNARKVINAGYSPITKSQWFDPKNGWNTANQAWVMGIIMGESDAAVNIINTWQSFVGFLCPEADYGVACAQYGAAHMIDADLFSHIAQADWRRATWIDPDDFNADNAEEIFNTKYKSGCLFSYNEWAQFGPYVGIKYHPGAGNRTVSTTGNRVDVPLMRVEEMYFIEAEATGRSQGWAAGQALLSNFLSTYRYEGAYQNNVSDLNSFITELLAQKRIEFWQETVTMYDYKRLDRQVTRGYTGTNHLENTRNNSRQGFCAPWLNMCISESEANLNESLVNNPDPSGYVDAWK